MSCDHAGYILDFGDLRALFPHSAVLFLVTRQVCFVRPTGDIGEPSKGNDGQTKWKSEYSDDDGEKEWCLISQVL